MNSPLYVVDPQLEPLLEVLKSLPTDLQELRRFINSLVPPPPAHAAPQELFVPSPEGHSIRVLVFKGSTAAPGPGILHIHGGAFVAGAPELGQDWCAEVARELDATVVSVAYRLAPETRYPGQLDDCYTILKWMHDNAKLLAIDRARVSVGGGSAGGALAASLSLLARDRCEVPIAYQRIIAGALDDRVVYELDPDRVFGLGSEDILGAFRSLLGNEPGAPDVSCYAAAARATDLSRLPPAFIAVGALDPLMEQNVAYATRLAQAGVQVELHVYPRAFHGFEVALSATISRELRQADISGLKRALLNR